MTGPRTNPAQDGLPRPKNTINPGHFGPGIIGQEEYDKEQNWRAKGANVFGTAVIGPSEPQKPTPEQLRQQPDLARLHGMETETPASPVAPTKQPQLSLDKLREALQDNPYIIDGAIEAEFTRAEGPRKGALRMILTEEQKKAEPRPEVVARLKVALGEPVDPPAVVEAEPEAATP